MTFSILFAWISIAWAAVWPGALSLFCVCRYSAWRWFETTRITVGSVNVDIIFSNFSEFSCVVLCWRCSSIIVYTVYSIQYNQNKYIELHAWGRPYRATLLDLVCYCTTRYSYLFGSEGTLRHITVVEEDSSRRLLTPGTSTCSTKRLHGQSIMAHLLLFSSMYFLLDPGFWVFGHFLIQMNRWCNSYCTIYALIITIAVSFN